MKSPISLALHGGAGTISRQFLTTEMENEYRAALLVALNIGKEVLESGGTAVDAVTATVVSLEDCPLFNAGKGSVFTHNGTHEMDASVMEGQLLKSGAVCGVQGIKNPVKAAAAVLYHSEHILLGGSGAEEFAKMQGLPFQTESYFHVPFRMQQWKEALLADKVALDHDIPVKGHSASQSPLDEDRKFGTVGAVARDKYGNLAAATSTGGMTNKKYGRVGDSPIIGAGTFADNRSCAISCTGHGEVFITHAVSHDIHSRMLYLNETLAQACHAVIQEKLGTIAPESGGLIALGSGGEPVLCFNTEGMYRAWLDASGQAKAEIYRSVVN